MKHVIRIVIKFTFRQTNAKINPLRCCMVFVYWRRRNELHTLYTYNTRKLNTYPLMTSVFQLLAAVLTFQKQKNYFCFTFSSYTMKYKLALIEHPFSFQIGNVLKINSIIHIVAQFFLMLSSSNRAYESVKPINRALYQK